MLRRLGGGLSLLYPLSVLLLIKYLGAHIPGSFTFVLKLYPAAVNGVFLAIFSLSLWKPPSVVERIARLQEPNLSARTIIYTRNVTKVWCVFFIFNGFMALATVLWASDKVWALYNGFIAYILIGCLFGIEWLVRQRFKALETS